MYVSKCTYKYTKIKILDVYKCINTCVIHAFMHGLIHKRINTCVPKNASTPACNCISNPAPRGCMKHVVVWDRTLTATDLGGLWYGAGPWRFAAEAHPEDLLDGRGGAAGSGRRCRSLGGSGPPPPPRS